MKLYDCCMYFDENLILDLRFNILKDHVDQFVVAEATKDHGGKDKKLNFNIKFILFCIFHHNFLFSVLRSTKKRHFS